VDPNVWSDLAFFLGLQWSPEQIAAKLQVSRELVYLHVYANKAAGGDLHTHLRSQKPRRKRHLCGRDRRGQIPNRRPISERPSHIEERKQVGHWEGDTVIGAAHKQAIDQGSLVKVLTPWTPQTKFGTHIVALCPPERKKISRNQALIEYLQRILK
jgi:IS30 family transposase